MESVSVTREAVVYPHSLPLKSVPLGTGTTPPLVTGTLSGMPNLWKHQRRLVDWAHAHPRSFLAAGMGSGKTAAALTLAQELKATLTLVGCPKAVIPAWESQAAIWHPKANVIRLDGKGTAVERCERALKQIDRRRQNILVGNYESIWRMPAFLKITFDLMICDECHKLKAHRGKAAKFFAKLSASATKVVGLSGTLLGQEPIDAFGVYRSCGLPHRFPRTLGAFQAKFCVMNPRVRGWVMGYKNLDEFTEIVAKDTMRIRTEDVVDLPPRVHTMLPVELSPKEVKAYQALRDELVHEEGGKVIMVENKLVLVLRLLQACSGHVRWEGTDAPEKIVDVPSKAAALAEVADGIDGPFVVFYRFTAESDDIKAALRGKKVGELSGRRNDLSSFQNGNLDVLAVQIAAGGTGIDLTRASHAIYYSGSPSLTDMDQSYARLHRPGAKGTVFISHLVARLPSKLSADEALYRGLEAKGDLIEAILARI